MADSESSVRQRKNIDKDEKIADDTSSVSKQSKNARSRLDEEDAYRLFPDVLRVLAFLLIASCGLSYVVSSGESFFWGVRNKPKYMGSEWWKAQFRGPLLLTPEQLAAFDGTDPDKPVYLAINGTIYDVSPGRHMYGPGGSYHWFAGCDASRGFVTGCFSEDRTPDLRGVEDMFLPVEEDDAEAAFDAEALAQLRENERAEAAHKVDEALGHWVSFFKNSPKYTAVGRVKLPKDWPAGVKLRELCAGAQKKRPRRKRPEGK